MHVCPRTARAHMWAPACQPSGHTLPHIQQPRGGYTSPTRRPHASIHPPATHCTPLPTPGGFANTTPHTHPNMPTLPLVMLQLRNSGHTSDCCTLLASRLLCTRCRVDCHICRCARQLCCCGTT